ncbi:MAG: type IV pilus assembly protein FimV [Ostreibacterium sp.]
MKKKLLSLLVGTVLLVPFLTFAVGLGAVRTYSYLNERLNAEIPVLSVKKKGGMAVTLAPSTVFAERGVKYSDILSDLKFSLIKKHNRSYVKVLSTKQMSVPYLNFILRLKTSTGTILREYAIFLDPKIGKRVSSQKQYAIQSPSRVATRKGVSGRTSSLSVINSKGRRYGPVRKGQTLWSIAKYTRPSPKVSVSSMLNAIRRANPKTLSNGLLEGAILNIPTIKGFPSSKRGYAVLPHKKIRKKKYHKSNQTITERAIPTKSPNTKVRESVVKTSKNTAAIKKKLSQ